MCIRSNLWNRFQSIQYFGNDTLLVHVSENMKSNPTIVAELFNYSVPTENILSNSVSFFQPTSLPPTHIPSASPTVQNIDHHVHDYSGEVVFRPSESGLGNNLLGLTSAFIIATVTNKKLCSRFCYRDSA